MRAGCSPCTAAVHRPGTTSAAPVHDVVGMTVADLQIELEQLVVD